LATRSIATLVKYQALSNIAAISERARRLRASFAFTAVPDDFAGKPRSEFDSLYMQELFKLGYEQARAGHAWLNEAPASPTLALR
jgi:hypothetical protein